ncbi:MAG: alpha/beta hydrolase [Gammaproteobacteria bacterium]|nr:alpha/beta hydrolase [Gammaproteobacteria bacterium]MDH4312173.1 alpha/beta hydrolase [Gammaproteobacteria bacterium]MDH5274603.1 alpha/beta hydrolase [Gammaproteobacteria bacterium]
MPVDPAFAGLLADKRSELRAPPAHVSVDDMRAGNKAYLITAPKTPIHAVEDRVLPGPAGPLQVRIYRPTSVARVPAIVFCHGGGFVLGDLDTHDSICHRLASSSGCAVVAVDYRRAPETRFPGALDDCTAALRRVAADAVSLDVDGERIALCGDSAGGNLAAATALRARRDGPCVRHVALLYPMLDPACDTESMHAYGRGHLLARSGVQWSWSQYLGAPDDAVNPLVALLRADLAGLPTTSVVTAEYDPLRDEGEAFAARLLAAGVDVISRRYAGMVHGFAGLPQVTPVATQAIDDIAGDIRSTFA